MSDDFDFIPDGTDLGDDVDDVDETDEIDAGEAIDVDAFALELNDLQRKSPESERYGELLSQLGADEDLRAAMQARGWQPLVSADSSGFEFDPELGLEESVRRYEDAAATNRGNHIQLDPEARSAIERAMTDSGYKVLPRGHWDPEELQRATHLLTNAFGAWQEGVPFPQGQTVTRSYTGPDGEPHVTQRETGGLRRERELERDSFPPTIFSSDQEAIKLDGNETFEEVGAMKVPEQQEFRRRFPNAWKTFLERESDERDMRRSG
jgi:hypothetical protein